MTTPTALRTRRRWLLLPSAALLLTAVAPISIGADRHFWRTLGDALHAPLLAAVAVLALAAQRADRPVWRRAAIATTIAVAVAIGVEIGQPWVGRSASVIDAINGGLGALAAIGGWLAWTRGGLGSRLVHAVACAVVLVVVSTPAWLEWRAIRWRETNRPLLGDFEHALEARLWEPVGAAHGTTASPQAGTATRGSHALEIVTAPGGWSGVAYAAGDADWSAHRRLAFEMYNAQQLPIELHVRIDDEAQPSYESRFNGIYRLAPGWNSISIPLSDVRDGPHERSLDLSRIRRLLLFVSPDTSSSRLNLDHLRLE